MRLRWAFPSACLRKGHLMDLVCACDGLSPLPVEEKAISWIWFALAMGFSTASPCLSKKRPSHGPSVRLRWACPPACQGKGRLMDLACAGDGISIHFLLSVQEKAVLWTWCAFPMTFPPSLSRKRLFQGSPGKRYAAQAQERLVQ